ncbi:fumarylacetoacetate hydrolase family protein [Variovorax sp. J22R133]|uniref:fumarylacetoacetate hydrolase family protein n=1 Tax=Variovorax brevis TaxID=3053503 RepID=UPI0025772FB7|nr:fumarylacetoacetate hydrolase family protein [Variovorax sp. J22R133]MDM0111904.1 fumarylacetoacetate hydrolase family protein [Variovorax sp. J22R133]
MNASKLDDLAQALATAWHEGRSIASAVPWQDVLQDADDAYLAQDALGRAMAWFGTTAVPGHWKSGGPSRDAVLTHAPLPPHGVRASPAQFGDMHFHVPGIEAEIALRLGEAVTPERAAGLKPEDAGALVDAMAVSIEIVDSRWAAGNQAPALLRLADMQSHGALVLGEWVPYAPRDWSAQRCEARIGTQETVARTGTHSLGDPAWLLPTWLRHVTRHGKSVPAGTVITTGTWVGVLPILAGQKVVVEFPGIGRAEATL